MRMFKGRRESFKREAIHKEAQPKKRYCRFKRSGMRYVDYKNPDFLKKFLNEYGRVLPRRITGNSLKYQRKVTCAVKRARHLALLPFVTDSLK